jgi:hypothetical protein
MRIDPIVTFPDRLDRYRLTNGADVGSFWHHQSPIEREGRSPDLPRDPGRRRSVVNRLHSTHWSVRIGDIIF